MSLRVSSCQHGRDTHSAYIIIIWGQRIYSESDGIGKINNDLFIIIIIIIISIIPHSDQVTNPYKAGWVAHPS